MSETAPEDVQEALARARHHGRLAAAEALAALQALLDAGALALDRPVDQGALATLRDSLLQVRRWLDPESGRDAAGVLAGVSQALDEEIQRWEEKSQDDPEARTILRAFLAVREVVWEFASRGAGTAGEASPPPRTGARRVPVEG